MIGLRGITLTIVWLLASGLAAAQSCPGVRIDTGTQEPRCILPEQVFAGAEKNG